MSKSVDQSVVQQLADEFLIFRGEAELADKELDVLYQRSKLPDKPDRAAINRLLVNVTTEFWQRHGLFKQQPEAWTSSSYFGEWE